MTLFIRNVLFIILTIVTVSVPSFAETLNERKAKIEAMQKKPTKEALTRKEHSEKILEAQLVPINKHLPVIETEKESTRRKTDEIIFRALALLVVAAKGEGIEDSVLKRIIKAHDLKSKFTKHELAFLNNPNPTQFEKVQFSWRYESALVLFWALGYVEALDKPVEMSDPGKVVKLMLDNSTKEILSKAKLRSQAEILDKADIAYRYHWAIVDARLKKVNSPASLDPGVVLEQHYALNWLIGYMGQEWDDVSTDT